MGSAPWNRFFSRDEWAVISNRCSTSVSLTPSRSHMGCGATRWEGQRSGWCSWGEHSVVYSERIPPSLLKETGSDWTRCWCSGFHQDLLLLLFRRVPRSLQVNKNKRDQIFCSPIRLEQLWNVILVTWSEVGGAAAVLFCRVKRFPLHTNLIVFVFL